MRPFDLIAHAVRAKEILGIIARHGFADLLDQIDLPIGVRQRGAPVEASERTTNQRIRMAAEELGPTFVKFGQLLSMRPDILPQPLILELRKLQNQVPALPFSVMEPLLDEQLGAPRDSIFEEFDTSAVASASLAQVYFATLREGKIPVAVKLQKPQIARNIEIDLDFLGWFAGQIHHRVASLAPYDLPAVVEELRTAVLRELDFRVEAQNQEYFNAINTDPGHVFAPKVFKELSTSKMIVMERISGRSVGELDQNPETGRQLASSGASSLMRQVLIHGFFHADPHAGNVMATSDGRLALIDWGLVGHLTRRLRYALADFWVSAVEQDAERIVQIAADLAPVDARPDLRAMEKDITLALREELNFAVGRLQLGRAMLKLLFIFGQNGIPLSRDYSLMAKAVLSIEEVGRTLDPNFNLRDDAKPSLAELYAERSSPKMLLKLTREFVRGSLHGLQDLPGELRRLVRRLEADNFTINLQHHGLTEQQAAMKSAANRIALGVIIGSLIIGSSLIVTTGNHPYLFGYPALGIVGYLLSAILGLYVIWDIIRTGGHK